MAITCEEKYESRSMTDGQSAELLFIIKGTSHEADALAALDASATEWYYGLLRQPLDIEPIHVDTTKDDASIWLGTARYQNPSYQQQEPPATGDSSFSFDTSGGTQHITQSLSTINRYAPSGKTAPDHKGAIGVTSDSVEGVDITTPVYTWSETHYLSDSVMTLGYRGSLFSLTGRVNSASFKGMAADECLFLGAAGSQRGSGEDWEINFRFAGSPNKTNITIGTITGIAKKGWEYLWVEYANDLDPAAKRMVKTPLAAHVEKVYEDGDFSILEIGM